MRNKSALIIPAICFLGSALPAETLVPSGALWKYDDSGTDLGTVWRESSYDDRRWASGVAQFGYGEGDEPTTLDYGGDPLDKHVTYYFRHSFILPEPVPEVLGLRVLRDDGCVVYFNGTEVWRSNMPPGEITFSTLAAGNISDELENVWVDVEIPATLQKGQNVIAVEVHQDAPTSSDLSFDLQLDTEGGRPRIFVPERALWRYDDSGQDLGVEWKDATYDDSVWSTGVAQLGYGESDEATTLSYGDDPNRKHPTYYFRYSFVHGGREADSSLRLRILRDDGCVVYFNGTEIFRSNMPAGEITFASLAAGNISEEREGLWVETSVESTLFREGDNVIAVEIHQDTPTSSDVSFDLELREFPDVTPFVDVTEKVGLSGIPQDGSAWGDFDGDGFPDLATGRRIYRNEEGKSFRRVGSYVQRSPSWGDYDNDGLLDLWAFRNFHSGGLYHNDGGSFTDVSHLIPRLPMRNGPSATWGDFNGDGWLDIYIAGHEEEIDGVCCEYDADALLFQVREGGESRFELVWTEEGRIQPSRAVSAADFDEDGDLDVYVANYRLERNVLWRNRGDGVFANVAETTHTSVGGVGRNVDAGHSTGVSWGDLNNDGHLDLVVANLAHAVAGHDRTKVYRNLGPDFDYRFEDQLNAHQIEYSETHASPTLGDFDNDGNLDLWITTFGYGANAVNVFYRGSGNLAFEKMSPDLGITDDGSNLQTAWADFDNDGNLDLLTDGILYRNPGQDTQHHWLKVRLVGELGYNTSAVGAQVRIPRGGRTFTRQVETQVGSEGNQSDLALHFGLGRDHGPVELEIRWTDGTITYQTTEVDRVVTVFKAPSFLRGDVNVDGNVDLSDAVAHLSSLFLGAGEVECADAADSNDDGDTDISDPISTLTALFLGGDAIPPPGIEDCGTDPSDDGLGCGSFAPCAMSDDG